MGSENVKIRYSLRPMT